MATSVWVAFRLGFRILEQILCVGRGDSQPPAAGLAEIDGAAAAALGPKAGSGIHFPPNPLFELTDMTHG